MSLDLTPLTKAIARLSEGLERLGREAGDTQLRDGLIQRFEFTYDLAHKMIRRALERGLRDTLARRSRSGASRRDNAGGSPCVI